MKLDMDASLLEFEKQWGIVSEKTALRPIGDRILVLEDPFKSRYDCKDCGGKGHTEEVCKYCLGTKKWKGKINSDDPCPDCTVTGELTMTYGKTVCPTCRGRKGTIVIPDDAKKRPTMGRIIAIGSKVTEWQVGDRVLYTNYTGQDFVVDGIVLRTMHELDPHCELKILDKTLIRESVNVDDGIATDPDNVGRV